MTTTEIMIYTIGQTIYIQSSRILNNVKVYLKSPDKSLLYKAAIINKLNYEKFNSTVPPGKYKLILSSNGFEYEKNIVITKYQEK